MKKIVKCILTLLVVTNSVFSQSQRLTTGLLPLTKEQEDEIKIIGAKLSALPTTNKSDVDLSIYFPEVVDQGIQESCAAFAVTEAITILINQKNHKTFSRQLVPPVFYSEFQFSPQFTFNVAKSKYPSTVNQNCQYGITFVDALNTAMNDGLVTIHDFPYNSSTDGCTISPDPYLDQAQNTKIYLYEPINVNSKIFKALLGQENGFPICIGLHIDQNYDDAGELHSNNNTWLTKGAPLIQTDTYHAMLVVGYNEDKQVFRVLDSRGINWGDNGIINISYSLIDNESKIVDAAYIPLLDNKLLGGEKVSSNGSTRNKSVPFEILNWRLGENRYTVLDGIRVIFVKNNSELNLCTFQFKDDITEEVLGDITYAIKINSTTKIKIRDHIFTIQPYKMYKRNKALKFYISVDK